MEISDILKLPDVGGEEAARELIGEATEQFSQELAIVSSFGAESAVLLHLVASIDPTVPVLFLNTGKLFGETLRYRDSLQMRLGLTDVRSVGPHPDHVRQCDPQGTLFSSDPDRCCAMRKVWPLQEALKPFKAWMTGRKRYQGPGRVSLPRIERADGKIKINPLADWTAEDVAAYRREHGLPEHPLLKDGFLSIGCMPCTDRVAPGEDQRAGRWRGNRKSECGIHNMSVAGPPPPIPGR